MNVPLSIFAPMPEKEDLTTVLHTRIPTPVYKEIVALAKKERRKMSNMSSILLEDALKARKK